MSKMKDLAICALAGAAPFAVAAAIASPAEAGQCGKGTYSAGWRVIDGECVPPTTEPAPTTLPPLLTEPIPQPVNDPEPPPTIAPPLVIICEDVVHIFGPKLDAEGAKYVVEDCGSPLPVTVPELPPEPTPPTDADMAQGWRNHKLPETGSSTVPLGLLGGAMVLTGVGLAAAASGRLERIAGRLMGGK